MLLDGRVAASYLSPPLLFLSLPFPSLRFFLKTPSVTQNDFFQARHGWVLNDRVLKNKMAKIKSILVFFFIVLWMKFFFFFFITAKRIIGIFIVVTEGKKRRKVEINKCLFSHKVIASILIFWKINCPCENKNNKKFSNLNFSHQKKWIFFFYN